MSSNRYAYRPALCTIAVMELTQPARVARQASGLADVDSLREPARLARMRRLVEAATDSTVLAGLVDLAVRATDSTAGQLSLLSDEQVATAIRCQGDLQVPRTLNLQDCLCSITVLSGDVLVAADSRTHPWLLDLLPITSGVVGAYLGVPLALLDGTLAGALCVWEPKPRIWSARDVELVCGVADLAAVELRRLGVG